MRRKRLTLTIILLGILIIGIFGFSYLDKRLNGDPVHVSNTAQILKNQIEDKYDIVITDSKGFYENVIGYGATLTTEDGLTFDAWNRQTGVVDFYQEAIWTKKGLHKWGYADTFIPSVDNVHLNIGYREESPKDKHLPAKPIEDIQHHLWITIYVDLKDSFKKKKAASIEEGIFNYYQALQKDGAKEIELIVRHKDDSGSYMITRDANGIIPAIHNTEDVSERLNK
ncbi:hypothetical protein ACFFJY_14800 [Fictibacillus aquaticus]|uniref:Uncharacterized protein n=1 Tax=Fictibacillus aquaticus TaxID=2021314 RepID=A0A235FDT6_9BACL|nr:hypothetical protein [Fictibacillus aquaticus]OYD59481.1 hypothetical protein CGZ90_06210 [Fictibacillus aquaticus]